MKILKSDFQWSTLAKKHTGRIFARLLKYFMLLIIGYIVFYPFLYMLSNAVKSERGLLDVTRIWLPRYFSSDAFKRAFTLMNFPKALKRTFTLQVVSALIEVFTCSVIAYGFARFKFRGKGIAMALLIVSLLIPTQMYSLPLSMNYRHLDIFGIFGLLNKLTGIDLRLNIYSTDFSFWLPSVFGVGIRAGMIIYIYIQFFTGLPYELEEAAYIDGAGLFKTYFRIALPSSSVVIVTVSVLSMVWHWNEYFLSALCFGTEEWPLSVALYNMETTLQHNGIWMWLDRGKTETTIFASCLLFIIIPLVAYLFLQRKFVKSIDRVGITG